MVVAKPLTKNEFETDSCVVDALPKMFNPVNVCDARLRSATLDERAESFTDADGSVRDPDDRVKPLEAVRSPPNVPVETVEKAPVLVVVALPLIESDEETETAVVLAFARVATPVNVGDADMTILPVPVWFVVVRAVPPLIVSEVFAVKVVNVPAKGVTAPTTTLLIWFPPPETVPPKVCAGSVVESDGTPDPSVTKMDEF